MPLCLYVPPVCMSVRVCVLPYVFPPRMYVLPYVRLLSVYIPPPPHRVYVRHCICHVCIPTMSMSPPRLYIRPSVSLHVCAFSCVCLSVGVSPPLRVYPSVCVSPPCLCPSVCVPPCACSRICLFVCISDSMCPSECVSSCGFPPPPPLCVPLHMYFPSVCIFLGESVPSCVFDPLSLHIYVNLPPPVCTPVCMFVRVCVPPPCVCPSVCVCPPRVYVPPMFNLPPCVCPSVCMSPPCVCPTVCMPHGVYVPPSVCVPPCVCPPRIFFTLSLFFLSSPYGVWVLSNR